MAKIRPGIPETIIISPESRELFLTLDTEDAGPLRDHGVISAGISDLKSPFVVGRQDPGFHVALFTLAGCASYRTLETSGQIGPGDLWIGPAHCAYEYVALEDWKVCWFHLAGAALPSGLKVTVDSDVPVAPMLSAMEGFVSEVVRRESSATVAAQSYAKIIGVYLNRALGRMGQYRGILHHLAALSEQVNADPGKDWTVELLADIMSTSSSHLYKLTRRHYGLAPMELVLSLRMRRAEDMLRGTDYTLDQIATAVGYQTPFAFSRAFKRHSGQSPREFRL